ncbi:uncharacterized protein IWZ02DRAFT_307624 [Phyllosticta citriasiana]|uniref:uncharacterized protein n=1 Tax=Phyllosticta citriasiana TaxID=595635 RepID=UPI0030FDC5E7
MCKNHQSSVKTCTQIFQSYFLFRSVSVLFFFSLFLFSCFESSSARCFSFANYLGPAFSNFVNASSHILPSSASMKNDIAASTSTRLLDVGSKMSMSFYFAVFKMCSSGSLDRGLVPRSSPVLCKLPYGDLGVLDCGVWSLESVLDFRIDVAGTAVMFALCIATLEQKARTRTD